jgi:outer membrane immunogenic protein
MRKILLSSVALFGFTAGALAADLPVRAAPPVFAAPVPVFTWTGFYVGVNAGFAFHGNNDRDNWWGVGVPDQALFGPPVAPVWTNITYAGVPVAGNWWDRDRRNDGGFTGGAQVGFNWQMTPGAGLVIGVEADINWLGGGRDRDNNWWGVGAFNPEVVAAPLDPAAAPGFGLLAPTGPGRGNVHLFNTGLGDDRGRRSDWYATVRARLGWGFDRMLVYATGGLAFADDGGGRDNWGGWGFNATPAAGFFVAPAAAAAGALVTPTWNNWGRDRNNVGWTIGGGVEWAFTNNLTVKLEALYVDLDNGNNRNNNWWTAGVNQIVGVTNTGAPVRSGALAGWGTNNRGGNDDFFVVRAGINFKFGS